MLWLGFKDQMKRRSDLIPSGYRKYKTFSALTIGKVRMENMKNNIIFCDNKRSSWKLDHC